ncbi:MAG: amidase family protein [Longimicrobiales bacterium]|nr:amidase family protein [Longimicrobiales bacterium]
MRSLYSEFSRMGTPLASLFVATAVLAGCGPAFVIEEATIAELHDGMANGQITAETLVQHYLDRIAAYDKNGPSINSLITVSDLAVERARELDRTFAASGLVGPMHGIPIVVKDNYDTYDLPTTNGVLALKGAIPPDDAFHVARLREAGAIVLAKANMAEFATSGAFSVSSVLPGFSRNPYDTRRVTAGSSGGTAAAVAANLGTVGLGSDTGSSIRGPASHQSLVGLRTTMGLSSRDGIAPLNSARDVGGPMARTVEDAVRVLEIIAGYDEADSVTARGNGLLPDGYQQFLRVDGLTGKRIGVLRRFFEVADAEEDGPQPSPVEDEEDEEDEDAKGEEEEREPSRVHPEVLGLLEQALVDMAASGATIVGDVDIPGLDSLRRAIPNIPRWEYDLNQYLATRPELARGTMQEILDSGDYHPWVAAGLRRAAEEELEGTPEEHEDWAAYLEATANLQDAVLAAMDAVSLDVLVYPTYNYPARLIGDLNTTYGANSGTLSPPTGFPAFSVPMGYVGGTLPSGLQLLGRPFDEGTMIEIAYAYEQATMHRRPPESTPPIPRAR